MGNNHCPGFSDIWTSSVQARSHTGGAANLLPVLLVWQDCDQRARTPPMATFCCSPHSHGNCKAYGHQHQPAKDSFCSWRIQRPPDYQHIECHQSILTSEPREALRGSVNIQSQISCWECLQEGGYPLWLLDLGDWNQEGPSHLFSFPHFAWVPLCLLVQDTCHVHVAAVLGTYDCRGPSPAPGSPEDKQGACKSTNGRTFQG